jgi:hypothetical protein
MKHRSQVQLIYHGANILLVGLLAGVVLMIAIDKAWGAGPVHSWAVAHTSISLTGVAFIAMAASLDHVLLSDRAGAILVRTLMVCAYTFCIGLVIGAVAGVAGLAPTGPFFNWVVFILFVTGAVAVLFGVAIFIWGARRAVRSL